MSEVGHNLPPTEDSIELLRERLSREHADLLGRRDDLLASATRAPEEVNNDEQAGKMVDFIKQLSGTSKVADTARVGEKEIYLAGGREVDGFFKSISGPLLVAKATMSGRMDRYLQLKEMEERRRRQEEEERARRAAEAAAEAAKDDDTLDEAVVAEEEARKAAEAADAKASEMGRSRGDHGALGSLRTTWEHDDLEMKTLDLETLRPFFTEDAVNAAIRLFIKSGGRELKGCRIFEKKTTVVR